MIHAISLAIAVAYDTYLEITEGKLDEDWRLSFPVDLWTSRDVLSLQILEYDPLKRKCIGDADIICVCVENKKGKT